MDYLIMSFNRSSLVVNKINYYDISGNLYIKILYILTLWDIFFT
jgi:hypothetical protein